MSDSSHDYGSNLSSRVKHHGLMRGSVLCETRFNFFLFELHLPFCIISLKKNNDTRPQSQFNAYMKVQLIPEVALGILNQVQRLWAASRKNNFDIHNLKFKAQDAEERLEKITSQVGNVRAPIFPFIHCSGFHKRRSMVI